MNELARDLVENDKFVDKPKTEVDQMLKDASKATPQKIPYFLHNYDKPGSDGNHVDGTATLHGALYFTLSWLYHKKRFRDFISITPDGLSFEKGIYFKGPAKKRLFRNSQELIAWFKRHYKEAEKVNPDDVRRRQEQKRAQKEQAEAPIHPRGGDYNNQPAEYNPSFSHGGGAWTQPMGNTEGSSWGGAGYSAGDAGVWGGAGPSQPNGGGGWDNSAPAASSQPNPNGSSNWGNSGASQSQDSASGEWGAPQSQPESTPSWGTNPAPQENSVW
jgi:hypothetical protein